tara:strand:+ start:33681 stop:33878 length:198 start_codon:yes stop_codon:yes gene_type:complete
MYKDKKIQKAVEVILERMLPRIYVSKLDKDDRNAVYSELKEWIDASDISSIEGGIIYCNYINHIS